MHCGLFLYGSCADYPAVCHPSCNNEKRTSDSYDIQPEGGFQDNEDCFPDYCYDYRRPYFPGIRGSGGLPLMFGNLIRGVRRITKSLSDTAQNELANLITLLLGITISFSMRADAFVRYVDTLMIMGIGLVAFIFDSIGGVLFAKFINLFIKNKINPMIGAAGISAFPMSARVVQKMASEEEKGNIILMHAVGANVSGQIASVIAGGLVIKLVSQYL